MAHLLTLTVDELIYATSMAMLDSARRRVAMPAPTQWLPGLGIAAAFRGQRVEDGRATWVSR